MRYVENLCPSVLLECFIKQTTLGEHFFILHFFWYRIITVLTLRELSFTFDCMKIYMNQVICTSNCYITTYWSAICTDLLVHTKVIHETPKSRENCGHAYPDKRNPDY